MSSTPTTPTMKTHVHVDTVEKADGAEKTQPNDAASSHESSQHASPSKKARKNPGSAGESKENKPTFHRFYSEKLAFEEYHLEPRDPTCGDFYRLIIGAIDRRGGNVPIVQLFSHKLKPSTLANALVVKYDNNEIFFSPKALKINASNLNDEEFLSKFLLGEKVQVERKEKKDRRTKEVNGYEYVYKFRLDLASLFARLGISVELTYFQKATLEFNPYFTLEEKRTVEQEQTNQEGALTLKFKSPYNETRGSKKVLVTNIARYFKEFITSLPNDIDREGNEKPKDLSRFGDSIFVFKNAEIQDALYSGYHLSAPETTCVTFSEEEKSKFKLSVPTFVDPGDYSNSSGLAGILTNNTDDGIELTIKGEDRYFGAPKGTELRRARLMVFNHNLYDYVSDEDKEKGAMLTEQLANEIRMEHGMQREGAESYEKKYYN